jgi:hypothetical protein
MVTQGLSSHRRVGRSHLPDQNGLLRPPALSGRVVFEHRRGGSDGGATPVGHRRAAAPTGPSSHTESVGEGQPQGGQSAHDEIRRHTSSARRPTLLFHRELDGDLVEGALRSYRSALANDKIVVFDRYELVDYAFKVVGVGSVGSRCWIALFEGRAAQDPLILQLKQAGRSVLEPHAGRSPYSHGGRRVVEGQRLVQAAGDIFLGWTRNPVEGIDYYVRQLWDMKGKIDTQLMNERSFTLFAEVSGWSLARAHARSGDPQGINGYIGSGDAFDHAISAFAVAYADQTEMDHELLCDALEKGELPGT